MAKIGIRVNILKATKGELLPLFQSIGAVAEDVEWYNNALLVETSDTRILTETTEYQEGKFYIQSLSSMIPALLLDPRPEDRVLDLCAAPGSKTTQIAELMQDTGEIVANDVSRERLYKLKSNLTRHGIKSVTIRNIPGEAFARKEYETFDKVLVDVPCSMGQTYATKNLRRLIGRQKKLLQSGFASLKCGGTLVYSTCSPREEENEEVIEWFLGRTPEARLETSLLSGMPNSWRGEKSWIKISASAEMEHFFVARLLKKCAERHN